MASSPRVGLLTDADHPDGPASDRPLTRALSLRDIPHTWLDWTNPVPTDRYDVLLIRSCWDYHYRPGEFRKFLQRVQARSTLPLLNPVPLIQWNINKRYLLDLQDLGIPTVPTVIPDPSHLDVPLDWTAEFEEQPEEIVVKPCVSAGADGLWKGPVEQATTERLSQIDREGVLVQPFRSAVKAGEWSLIGIGGNLAHTVHKCPTGKDFRVQPSFGGRLRRREAPAQLEKLFYQVMDVVSPEPHYARVDLIVTPGGPELMELELIEPNLYLDKAPRSADRLVNQLISPVT